MISRASKNNTLTDWEDPRGLLAADASQLSILGSVVVSTLHIHIEDVRLLTANALLLCVFVAGIL